MATHDPFSALDNPAWHALATKQALLRVGTALAARYDREVSPFGAVAEPSTEAMERLGALIDDNDVVLVQSLATLPAVEGLRTSIYATIAQMVAEQPVTDAYGLALRELGDADRPAMLALATTTKPGPFTLRTPDMGHYVGTFDDGKLIGMAGERMRMDGFTEISAVCVDPDYRGRGLAGKLMAHLAGRIVAGGETPFLHVLTSNTGAIGLYEKLGYRVRATFTLYKVQRV